MKNYILLAISLLFLGTANAQSFEFDSEIAIVKCKGTKDQFSIFLTSYIDPATKTAIASTAEIGYIVKVWESKDAGFLMGEIDSSINMQSNYVAIEGAIESNQTTYKYTMPWFYGETGEVGGEVSGKGQNNEFVTSLTLKTGIVNGNVKVECTAALKKTKTKSEVESTSW